jgi:pimeloyl-ACP methyl ester carboxylesterase
MPVTFVRLARDNALPPATQDACIARLRREVDFVDVIELDAGHDVMISAPASLAAVLDEVAAAAT